MDKFEIDKDNNITIVKDKEKYRIKINIKEDRKYTNINIKLNEKELDELIAMLVSSKAH